MSNTEETGQINALQMLLDLAVGSAKEPDLVKPHFYKLAHAVARELESLRQELKSVLQQLAETKEGEPEIREGEPCESAE